ncbi:heterogeneous nuclear ribonucleoprotein 1 isoform X1 [Brassica rapa]|uniref:heterogeneous nuclear ribonucleoprotein 1 isoform X1 n=1 Tax=Brassica campestris TaxID=3711 RepID=UPI0004F1629F|nr:heterogeneous nuclear ribonucleoprotein 1 isoform X1 [Brassica rapa]XP_009124125.1 heterogeneous nuclear ribonucleoprotein 1 isoform X1 [Brassica rapa]XP_013724122.1 heterogeneous nuclear ribonucleoprotein 1 isoform X1 [Brassica napus]XP_048615198.1 heterogeneous nuclear ribonucleoprotein 1-like isoform X1 [Brassica napus]XP_048615219.1 heterogeneous nuclear ribonucleoprotein 1-like isoform X1 [Brassica napus]XP_048628859.1 heterogeneous nuclear ribonucleoprotein 1-like isoform X1 [Brassica
MQSDNGKLFIGGISWDTNEERLKEYFSSFGEVIEAVILKDRTTGRARGFGFVVFADPAVAEIVITEKHSIDGRLVEAKKAVPRDDQNTVRSNSSSIQGSPGGPGARTRKIFVGGLPSSVTESDFKTYFEQFGTPTDVVVMYDHNTQRPRGFGFITYDSEEAVEKVLLKTFHELNGKMVEVKRAVPKELSPSPARSPLGAGYSYGVSRVNNLLNGYAQGFSPGAVGGYGLRMDGRFSPVGAGRTGFANFGSGYGMNVNFEQGLPTGFTGGNSFNGNVDYGRGMSPYYIGNTNRFGPGGGYEGGNGGGGGGNSSFFSSVTRNLWGNNGGLNSNSNTYMGGTTSGNNTLSGPFGNSWGAPGGGGGSNGVSNESMKFGYGGNGESGFGLGTRNIGPSKAAPSSSFSSASVANNTGYDGAGLAEFYGNGAVYSDPTWRSSAPETEGPGSFSYGIGGGGGGGGPSSDVSARSSSPGYVGSYKRQSNRGEPSR